MSVFDIIKKGANFVPGAGPLISAGLDVAESALTSKGANEAAEAGRAADIATDKLGVEKSEDKRGAAAAAASAMMPQMEAAGFMGLDPETMAKISERRNYDDLIEAGAVDKTAGSAEAFLAGLAGDAGDYMAQHNVSQDVVPEGGVGTAGDPALQGGAVDFPSAPVKTTLDNPLERKKEFI